MKELESIEELKGDYSKVNKKEYRKKVLYSWISFIFVLLILIYLANMFWSTNKFMSIVFIIGILFMLSILFFGNKIKMFMYKSITEILSRR